MDEYIVVHSRSDRELKKRIIKPGDYNIVPYEDSRCKVVISEVVCVNEEGSCDIEHESRVFSKTFDGNILIGDSDCFIDRDFELILQQMCSGEICSAQLIYRDSKGVLVKDISCNIEVKEVMEEQLISDWGWQRLYESATHNKDRGVILVKEKRVADAFRRFSKALKMLVAIEPIDPDVIDEDKVIEMIDVKVKLYNNLAYCQLQYKQYQAAVDLCSRALQFDSENVKALYRRSLAYSGLGQVAEAWADIQQALAIEPNDKAARKHADTLKPILHKIEKNYNTVIKKMFPSQ